MKVLVLATALLYPFTQQQGAPAAVATSAAQAGSPLTASNPEAKSFVFRVRVVDGRNGEAIQGAHLALWYDEKAGSGYTLTTNADGSVSMPPPVGDPVRILISVLDRVDCSSQASAMASTAFSLQQIARSGLSAPNHCGRVGQHSLPGELVLFARPPRWYEGLNRPTGT